MKVNELRIGNLVNVCDNDEILTGVFKSGVNFGEHGYCANIPGFIKPIPLTEEWLVKFGFKYSKRAEVWYFGENPVTKDWMITIKWIDGEEYPFYENGHFKVKYVHQLQNLYFALTGEDLELKQSLKQKKMKWIYTEKKLPPLNIYVLVSLRCGNNVLVDTMAYNGRYWVDRNGKISLLKVKYWMLKPKPVSLENW